MGETVDQKQQARQATVRVAKEEPDEEGEKLHGTNIRQTGGRVG